VAKFIPLQCIVNGEENPQNFPFPLGFRHPGGGVLRHGHRQHAQKTGKDHACRSGDILMDRQTCTHTDILITILCTASTGEIITTQYLYSHLNVYVWCLDSTLNHLLLIINSCYRKYHMTNPKLSVQFSYNNQFTMANHFFHNCCKLSDSHSQQKSHIVSNYYKRTATKSCKDCRRPTSVRAVFVSRLASLHCLSTNFSRPVQMKS